MSNEKLEQFESGPNFENTLLETNIGLIKKQIPSCINRANRKERFRYLPEKNMIESMFDETPFLKGIIRCIK